MLVLIGWYSSKDVPSSFFQVSLRLVGTHFAHLIGERHWKSGYRPNHFHPESSALGIRPCVSHILTPLFVVSATLRLSPLNLKYPNHAVTTNFNAFWTNVAIKLSQRNTCATANKTSNNNTNRDRTAKERMQDMIITSIFWSLLGCSDGSKFLGAENTIELGN